MILIIVAYFIVCLAVAFLGKDRTIGFVSSFIISLLLTPIAGLLVVVNSSRLILYHIVQHDCPECGYSFDSKHDFCPLCLKEGKYIVLNPNIVPTT